MILFITCAFDELRTWRETSKSRFPSSRYLSHLCIDALRIAFLAAYRAAHRGGFPFYYRHLTARACIHREQKKKVSRRYLLCWRCSLNESLLQRQLRCEGKRSAVVLHCIYMGHLRQAGQESRPTLLL